ncbi:MAG: bifunctional 2-C-methyl-D-erythritol 4-phosphate cytidylyltransferase/2-C-methyl-D-erythritol 2,4-cyclodiphosphate synthase [Pseudomonadota bacterium]
MKFVGLIVAAGRGERMGSSVPKQYLNIGDRSVLRCSIETFLKRPDTYSVLVVIHPNDRALYDEAITGIADKRLLQPVEGCATRSGSVRAGLEALQSLSPSHVLIHDGARAHVTPEIIGNVLSGLESSAGALPAVPVVDALWQASGDHVVQSVPRAGLWRAQTPQGFSFPDILAAHRAFEGEAADDVAVASAAGLAVRVVEGAEENYKITTRSDLERAERDLNVQPDVRTGQGFDVHALGPGQSVILCGVEIPNDHGLVGHSDADVGMHALTDAIFGALAEGDIGQWFPPTSPAWKGAASAIFLAKAVERANARSFTITHLDCTLICERPKIGPHSDRMREELGRIAGLSKERISVKATTSEKLGFAGRGEGIAALATATLVRK